MSEDYKLELQTIDFVKYLGIDPQNNYFICYRYPLNPILGLIPFKAITQSLITRVVLLVFTPDEIVIKKLGGILSYSFINLNPSNFSKNVTRISKAEIKRFEIKRWRVVGIDWGYLMTLEADKKYYFHLANPDTDDFSTLNFFNVKGNHFYGLLTKDETD